MDFSLKASYKYPFNFSHYSNTMCILWNAMLSNCVFQMLKENDNVANLNNQWKLCPCLNYIALKELLQKWTQEKLERAGLLKK